MDGGVYVHNRGDLVPRLGYWPGAHVRAMRLACAGVMEYELEAAFQHECYAGAGCRFQAYTAICACGPNSAVLHYGHAAAPNDRRLAAGDMALLDMGAVAVYPPGTVIPDAALELLDLLG